MEHLPKDVQEIVYSYTVKGAKAAESVCESDNEEYVRKLCTDMVSEINKYCRKKIDPELFVKIIICGVKKDRFAVDSPKVRALVNAHWLLGVGKVFYNTLTVSSKTDNTVDFILDYLEQYKTIDIPMIASKELSEVFAIEGLKDYFKGLSS